MFASSKQKQSCLISLGLNVYFIEHRWGMKEEGDLRNKGVTHGIDYSSGIVSRYKREQGKWYLWIFLLN